MPKKDWIKDAVLIPEYQSYKIDTSGRIIIPSNLRSKFQLEIGDEVNIYTCFAGDKWFICYTPKATDYIETKSSIENYNKDGDE